MNYNQLNLLLSQVAENTESEQIFYVPLRYLQFVRIIIQKTIRVVPGQPNLPVPDAPGTPVDFLNLLGLLSQPSNGHKLLLPAAPGLLVTAILRRVVRRPGGAPFAYDGSGNPILNTPSASI
jgi:hypothetical protein